MACVAQPSAQNRHYAGNYWYWSMVEKAARKAWTAYMLNPFQRLYVSFTPVDGEKRGEIVVDSEGQLEIPRNLDLHQLTYWVNGFAEREPLIGAECDPAVVA